MNHAILMRSLWQTSDHPVPGDAKLLDGLVCPAAQDVRPGRDCRPVRRSPRRAPRHPPTTRPLRRSSISSSVPPESGEGDDGLAGVKRLERDVAVGVLAKRQVEDPRAPASRLQLLLVADPAWDHLDTVAPGRARGRPPIRRSRSSGRLGCPAITNRACARYAPSPAPRGAGACPP